MAVTAKNAVSAILVRDDLYVVVDASGTAFEVNPGDYVAFSGFYAVAANTGVAGWKASGIGIALDRNPVYDQAGRCVVNSSLLVATHGIFRVSACFSGQPLFGTIVSPVTTGSGVNAPSGVTGVGATWNTGAPLLHSGATAAAAAQNGVAQVINYFNSGPAGTGQLDIRLWPRTSDFF
jgi:hypothetical protein